MYKLACGYFEGKGSMRHFRNAMSSPLSMHWRYRDTWKVYCVYGLMQDPGNVEFYIRCSMDARLFESFVVCLYCYKP